MVLVEVGRCRQRWNSGRYICLPRRSDIGGCASGRGMLQRRGGLQNLLDEQLYSMLFWLAGQAG